MIWSKMLFKVNIDNYIITFFLFCLASVASQVSSNSRYTYQSMNRLRNQLHVHHHYHHHAITKRPNLIATSSTTMSTITMGPNENIISDTMTASPKESALQRETTAKQAIWSPQTTTTPSPILIPEASSEDKTPLMVGAEVEPTLIVTFADSFWLS